MNENEKAAIAARGWKPGQKCPSRIGTGFCTRTNWTPPLEETGYPNWHKLEHIDHDIPAPDMHDPANWVRALKASDFYTINKSPTLGIAVSVTRNGVHASAVEAGLDDAIFAALVALYDAEHPESEVRDGQ